jgi:hypothetical protein
MSEKPINLRLKRKQQAREEKRKKAAENAARYGRSRVNMDFEMARMRHLAKMLDGHKRDG